jgi:Na+:H+ antiporter, NhaA family
MNARQPDQRRPVRRALGPLAEFLREEAAGGVVLLGAAVVALVWANSPARDEYASLWETQVQVGIGSVAIEEDLRHWINDGLMALFFFVVGLEIKRELAVGELSDRRAAALPALAAAGGVAAPALIFTAIVAGGDGAAGWAIPMATDIAFAVGVLALLGDRVSAGVKLLVLAIAVVDDIIAIAVIAIFYSDAIAAGWLAAAGALLVLVYGMRRAGVTRVAPYVPVGIAVWVAVLESGVHATIAGVALGLLTPAGRIGGRAVLEELEHRLHPVSAFVAVPLFALANAGVYLGGGKLGDAASSRVAWVIAVALVAGKLAGIAASVFGGVRAGVGVLPAGTGRGAVWGAAALGGIGFTVSLFIAGLAFDDPGLQDQAKVGIFAGSIVSGALGAALLISASSASPRRDATSPPRHVSGTPST